jgi:2,3-bisphosphoglycerate-dependent phosphoglycerate mutase
MDLSYSRSSYSLVLLRHGQSEWNARDLFTGWVDAALTRAGEEEGIAAGRLLAAHGLWPDIVHTSVQRRSIRTCQLVLSECNREWIPVRRSWRLNANHYGALQGREKSAVLAEVGERQFMAWRRSYDSPPPPLATSDPNSQFSDPRYAAIPPDQRPRSESLKDVTARLLPYWIDAIIPDLRTGARVLVVSHGNTLRALVKHLDNISESGVRELNIPTATPIAYELGVDMRPVRPGGSYLR